MPVSIEEPAEIIGVLRVPLRRWNKEEKLLYQTLEDQKDFTVIF